MTAQQLEDPAPTAGPLTLADPPTPEARPKKDAKAEKWITSNGRYALPDPDTGKDRTWTRVTTLADTLESRYNLERWGERMAVKGVSMRPDLIALAQGADPDDYDDKKTLNKVVRQAKEVAGASRGANMGTALHRLTELEDAGREVRPGSLEGELNAYRALMATRRWRAVPTYLERIVCVPELGCAGRLDKLLECAGDPRLMVGDLKSQKSMDFGGLKIAIQLAIYSHAYAMWNEDTETWENPPLINQEEAVVLWAPIGRSLCEPYWVNLERGWNWALVSLEVREGRKEKLVLPWSAAPVRSTRGVMAAAGPDSELPPADSLAALGEALAAAGSAGAPPFQNVLEKAREEYPALMKAAREVDDAESQDPYQTPAAWAQVFTHCTDLEELTYYGQRAAEALGGLPDSLKALGRDLRAKLSPTAP